MIVRKPLLAAVTLAIAFVASAAFAAGETPAAPPATQIAAAITKEQATEMALKAHPGKVTKANEDARKGKKTWEVKITGDDGKKWEIYYEIATGTLVDDKEDQ